MRYRLIDEEKSHHAVPHLARVLGVSCAGYYAWVGRPPSKRSLADAALTRRIEQIHEQTDGIYGAPRIYAELADEGIRVGRRRVARLLRQAGLAGVSKRRTFHTTTPGGEAPAAPDLVCRKFTAERPNELWFADITYVPTWQGWLYLAAVVDACSRYCVGWSMRDDLSAELVYDALGMAVTRRRPSADLIHHSAAASTARWPTDACCVRARSCPQWAAAAMPTTTPLWRASWRRSRRSSSIGGASRPETRQGWRSSSASRPSTTRCGGTRRWGREAR